MSEYKLALKSCRCARLHQAVNMHEAEPDAYCMAGVPVAYIGFDATADSLHVGSLLQIMMLRHLQKAGGKPIVLMGGGTTKVGDPTDKENPAPCSPMSRSKRTLPASRKPSFLPDFLATARPMPSWSTMTTGWASSATSSCCAKWACTSPSTQW
ncbi:MAG: hypothetical protein R3C00_07870 [Hyphomonas sp.]